MALVYKTGGLLRGGVHAGIGRVDFDGLLDGGDTEDEVELNALSNGERDAGLLLRGKTLVFCLNGVGADWDGWRDEAAFGVGGEGACGAGFCLADGNGCIGKAGSGRVMNDAADGAADDLSVRTDGNGEKNEGKRAKEAGCHCYGTS